MKRLDRKSELLERKAIVLSRFSMADALSMCGRDVPDFTALQEARKGEALTGIQKSIEESCPSCRARALEWSKPSMVGGYWEGVPDAATAVKVRCGICHFSGGSVEFVMANFNINSVSFALGKIEDWIVAECKFAPFIAVPAGRFAERNSVRGDAPKMKFSATPRRVRKRVIR